MFLPDVNLWLALAFQAHAHHPIALRWFETTARNGVSCFCRLTQQGFLRVATNPKSFPGSAVSLAIAWRMYDELLDDPRVGFAAEPAGLESAWRVLTLDGSISHRVWSDAYLAAFAQVSGLQMVTFDKGFSRFHGVNCQILA